MASFDYFEFLKNSDNSKFDKEQFKLVLDVCPGYGNIERDEYFTILDKKVRRLYGYLQRKSNVDVIRLLLEKAKQLPAISNARYIISGTWLRTAPEASSTPLHTKSY